MTTADRQNLASSMQDRLLRLGAMHESSWILDHVFERLPHGGFEQRRDLVNDILKRRESQEPLAYILGSWAFRSHEFRVGPGALIPRPETEELVEAVLKTIHNTESTAQQILHSGYAIADLGAGSGCLGLSLVADLIQSLRDESFDVDQISSKLELHLVEASAEAREWLTLNSRDMSPKLAKTRVHIHGESWGEWFSKSKPVDLIVSNPPYVAALEYESCEDSVRNFEPKAALVPQDLDRFPDASGPYREILRATQAALRPGGWLWFELGTTQGDWIKDFAMQLGYLNDVRTMRDLARKVRFFCARKSP